MASLKKVILRNQNRRGRDSMEIAEKAVNMIQDWGEAFLPHRAHVPLFVSTYHDLRKAGVAFNAQYDASKAPVFTPPAITRTWAPAAPVAAGAVARRWACRRRRRACW